MKIGNPHAEDFFDMPSDGLKPTDTPTPARPALDAMAEEIERLEKLATPWPWQVRFMHRVFDSARKDPINLFDTEAKQDWTDCELIVYLRNNAPALVAALRSLADMREALEATQASELAHSNCEECNGEGEAERCEKCFPVADDARLKRLAALAQALPLRNKVTISYCLKCKTPVPTPHHCPITPHAKKKGKANG